MLVSKKRLLKAVAVGLFLFAVAVAGALRAEAEKGERGHGHGKTKDTHGKTMKDNHGKGEMAHGSESQGDDKPIIITMDELHASGGTPPGWRFRIPKGDAEEGREVFVKMECFSCHNIDGEKFPKRDKKPTDVGPDLTGMGAMHGDVEYFFESIVNPSRVILKGPGYIKDGRSIMPDYADSIGLREVIDLVAYLKSLKGGHKMEKGMQHGKMKEIEKGHGNPCAMKKGHGNPCGMGKMKH